MRNFFVTRPVFAAVISIVIALAGAISMITLPISRFPKLAPPVVRISATYPGGDAEQAAKAVATPLEQEINGSPGLIYLASLSSNNGDVAITATFEVGYDLNAAAADILTRVNRANSKLPQSVQAQGVSVRKASRQQLAAVVLYGDEKHQFDELFLSNYAETQVVKPLRRVSGVGRINNTSEQRFATRIWLNPVKMEALRVDPSAIVSAISAQNTQVAAGTLGELPMKDQPAFEMNITSQGRLRTPSQFDDIIIRADPNGSVVRLRDVGHAELGSEVYGISSGFSGRPSATLQLYQNPDANAVQVMAGVRSTMKGLEKRFPPGLKYRIALDRTQFVTQSIHEVIVTLGIAIVLVVAVIYLFLQSWRATLIPCVAIPVALIGTFGPMALFGFSINTLSLLGLVLAVGLVVDDAIVVVENTQRNLEDGRSPHEAAERALAEVAGPVIATTLVLLALFVPVAFVPGITGLLYNQFALTIAISVALSAIVSLTLTPALCAILLRKGGGQKHGLLHKPLDWFNAVLHGATAWLTSMIERLSRHLVIVGAVFAVLIGITVVLFMQRPVGFIPQEDQGYFYVDIDLPKGASLDRTKRVVRRVSAALHAKSAVQHTVEVAGQNVVSDIVAPFYGYVDPVLKQWSERSTSAQSLMADLNKKFENDPDARIRAKSPPPVPGLGAIGGITFEIEDRSGEGGRKLRKEADRFIAKVSKLHSVVHASATTTGGVPEIRLDIDRAQAAQLGVDLKTLFDAVNIYLGAAFVNEFNRFGLVYQVYVQSDQSGRRTVRDLDSLTVPNASGKPVRLGSLVRTHFVTGPTASWHYDTYPAVEVNVDVAAGASSGGVIAAVDKLADQELGRQYALSWTDVAYQQRQSGGYAPIIFGLGIVMVFLVLAAQYESWVLPLVIVLAVPLAVFGALAGLAVRSLNLDIFGQVGLLILVGLAAKNSILLVSFAKERRAEGEQPVQAAVDATRLRLRPILMTSLAFILGNIPLAIATGAGANSRISIGTTVIGGMLAATFLTLFITPLFYVAAERLRGGRRGEPKKGEAGRREKAVHEAGQPSAPERPSQH